MIARITKSAFLLLCCTVIITSCNFISGLGLFGGGGRPTSTSPGNLSTTTGLAYNDEQGGFVLNPFEGQPDGPNLVFIEGGRTVLGSGVRRP